jgi:hypothetical protein
MGSALPGAELTDLLRREGVLQAEYEQWRLALGDEGRAGLATTKQIPALEREQVTAVLEFANRSSFERRYRPTFASLCDATVATFA